MNTNIISNKNHSQQVKPQNPKNHIKRPRRSDPNFNKKVASPSAKIQFYPWLLSKLTETAHKYIRLIYWFDSKGLSFYMSDEEAGKRINRERETVNRAKNNELIPNGLAISNYHHKDTCEVKLTPWLKKKKHRKFLYVKFGYVTHGFESKLKREKKKREAILARRSNLNIEKVTQLLNLVNYNISKVVARKEKGGVQRGKTNWLFSLNFSALPACYLPGSIRKQQNERESMNFEERPKKGMYSIPDSVLNRNNVNDNRAAFPPEQESLSWAERLKIDPNCLTVEKALQMADEMLGKTATKVFLHGASLPNQPNNRPCKPAWVDGRWKFVYEDENVS